MSISLSAKLTTGLLLLSITQIIAPAHTAAKTIAPTLTNSVVTGNNISRDKPTFSIAQSSPTPRRIQFPRGARSTFLENSVVRGTRDTYLINAKKNQRMNVSITSLENNAVFDIIDPNGEVIQGETMSWSFILPATGDYQIVVGGTRGNATYKMFVEIK
jgi:hypothetical protein